MKLLKQCITWATHLLLAWKPLPFYISCNLCRLHSQPTYAWITKSISWSWKGVMRNNKIKTKTKSKTIHTSHNMAFVYAIQIAIQMSDMVLAKLDCIRRIEHFQFYQFCFFSLCEKESSWKSYVVLIIVSFVSTHASACNSS